MAIYQRNIIASLVKYILLKDILQKLDTSPLTDTYKGVFSSMLKRLQEIIFECDKYHHSKIIFARNLH